MKHLLFFFLLCMFVCSLIGMYKGYEKDYAQKMMQQHMKRTYSLSAWVKTYDNKMIKIPVWQIDQIQKLQEHLLGQKDKNSEKNPINITDLMIREATELKQMVITVDILQCLVSAFKNSGSSENFSSFFTNLDKDTQKKLINTAGVLGANKILSLSVPMIFPQELYKEIGIGDDKIGLVVSYLKSFEKKVFNGHTLAVRCVAFSPDETYIVSGSNDKTLILWNVRTGKQVRIFEGHIDWIRCVAYSPDGKYIVSGAQDKTLILWDAQMGEKIRFFKGHAYSVNCVAYSPDGGCIVSGSYDHILILWDVQTGNQIKQFHGHTEGVSCVVYSSDGEYIVSGSNDKTLILWNVRTGEQIKTFKGHTDWIRCVAYSPDGEHVVSGSWDRILILWNVRTGGWIKKFDEHTNVVTCVAYSPNGKCIVSGSFDKILILRTMQTGKQTRIFEGHTKLVNCVTYSSNGEYIVSGSDDGTLILRLMIDERILAYIANELRAEQKEFIYRLYEATVRKVSVILDFADPDYMVYQLLPIDVQGLIRRWFPFHLLGYF